MLKNRASVGRPKFFLYAKVNKKFPVEAAGIEPASRDISMQASTCVVDYLISF